MTVKHMTLLLQIQQLLQDFCRSDFHKCTDSRVFKMFDCWLLNLKTQILH